MRTLGTYHVHNAHTDCPHTQTHGQHAPAVQRPHRQQRPPAASPWSIPRVPPGSAVRASPGVFIQGSNGPTVDHPGGTGLGDTTQLFSETA